MRRPRPTRGAVAPKERMIMKWKDVKGSGVVLRYTDVGRIRKITKIGKDKHFGGPKLEPQKSHLRKECQTDPP
jgi:hypothetical protein